MDIRHISQKKARVDYLVHVVVVEFRFLWLVCVPKMPPPGQCGRYTQGQLNSFQIMDTLAVHTLGVRVDLLKWYN